MSDEAPGQALEALELPRAPSGNVVLCAACSRVGRCRLGIVDEVLCGEFRSETLLVCPSDHEGGPGVAHGGWTASVMDEALGHLALLCGSMTVTASLTVEFVRPVPIERALVLTAWREAVEGNRWRNGGELVLKSTGAVLARARGAFVLRDRAQHFAKFRDWLAKEERPRAS